MQNKTSNSKCTYTRINCHHLIAIGVSLLFLVSSFSMVPLKKNIHALVFTPIQKNNSIHTKEKTDDEDSGLLA